MCYHHLWPLLFSFKVYSKIPHGQKVNKKSVLFCLQCSQADLPAYHQKKTNNSICRTMLVLWKLILLSSVGIFGLSGNLLAVVTLVKNPNVMGESQKFILNQSVIDALTAVMLFLSDINIRAAGIVIHYQDNW